MRRFTKPRLFGAILIALGLAVPPVIVASGRSHPQVVVPTATGHAAAVRTLAPAGSPDLEPIDDSQPTSPLLLPSAVPDLPREAGSSAQAPTARSSAQAPTARSSAQEPTAGPAQGTTTMVAGTGIAVLMYHFIRVAPVADDRVGVALSVTPAAFEAELALLAAQRIRTLSPDEFMQAVYSGHPLQEPAVLLTFDDGFADFATTAAPLLHKYGMTGIDYVVSGRIGTANHMSIDQLHQVEGLGMHIGAHTVHHVPLARVSASTMVGEIEGSKRDLERILGHPVLDFAYPYGSHSAAVEAAVKAAGFRSAVTTDSGWVQPLSAPFTLRRVRVAGGESLAAFASSVTRRRSSG